MGLARIAYARNDLEQAKRDAASSVASARQARSYDSVATGELFLAVVALKAGDRDGASARLGEAERSVRTHRLARRTAELDAVRALIADRLTAERRRELAAAVPSVEPLTERELEVLRLIAQGLSNREIGDRLFLALDSVKGHNRRIFEKLQVKRRTEAIALARTLGWIE
jgi:LuxR family maltose regulon positive regulatory protein